MSFVPGQHAIAMMLTDSRDGGTVFRATDDVKTQAEMRECLAQAAVVQTH